MDHQERGKWKTQGRSRVRTFEAPGSGLFVRFGPYSVLGKGERARGSCQIPVGDAGCRSMGSARCSAARRAQIKEDEHDEEKK